MFTWICPKCGAEVPPSYAECPKCAAQGATPAAAPEAATAAPVPPPAPPVTRPTLPASLLAVLFAVAFVVILGGGYLVYQKLTVQPQQPTQAPALEPPSLPTPEAVKEHPMIRHVEITGLRLTEDAKQKAFIQFVVVNHSAAEIGDLSANVTLLAISARGERQPVGTFSFKIPLLGPYESKDLKETVDTRLRVYELPDWQFLRSEFQITSP